MSINIGVDVSRETIDRLQAHLDLVVKWTKQINLIAPMSSQDAWHRHVLDSAQIYQYAPDFIHWIDLGSGGGFPGVVCAIIAKERNPSARFTCLESDLRKATFLRTAARELDLNLVVMTDRIQVASPQSADIVSARALSPLPKLLALVDRHLSPTGTAILMKGQNHAEEIADASAKWTYTLESFPSMTDKRSRILALKGLNRAN